MSWGSRSIAKMVEMNINPEVSDMQKKVSFHNCISAIHEEIVSNGDPMLAEDYLNSANIVYRQVFSKNPSPRAKEKLDLAKTALNEWRAL